MSRTLQYVSLATPLGPMLAIAEERGLLLLDFADRPILNAACEELRSRYGCAIEPRAPRHAAYAHLELLEGELQLYFAGATRDFTVPLLLHGSEFQERVWTQLRAIPYGATRSYGQIAAAIGSPAASRAVGAANGQNCLAVVVPCHRVVGANGALTGYSGGASRKAFLLQLEGQGQESTKEKHPVQERLFEA